MVEAGRADVRVLVARARMPLVTRARGNELGREGQDGEDGQEPPDDHDAQVEQRARHQYDHREGGQQRPGGRVGHVDCAGRSHERAQVRQSRAAGVGVLGQPEGVAAQHRGECGEVVDRRW
jgi:hypothetical protein